MELDSRPEVVVRLPEPTCCLGRLARAHLHPSPACSPHDLHQLLSNKLGSLISPAVPTLEVMYPMMGWFRIYEYVRDASLVCNLHTSHLHTDDGLCGSLQSYRRIFLANLWK